MTSSFAQKDLITEIHRLSTEKQSGTIFLTSHDGHLARVVLNDGKITHLVFDSKYVGYDAINFIQKLTFARLQFISGVFETAEEVPLPDTNTIFQTLRGEESAVEKSNRSNFNETIKQITTVLAHNIGPIATIACEEYLENKGSPQTLDDVFAMIDTVALEITESDAQEAFKQKIKTEIV